MVYVVLIAASASAIAKVTFEEIKRNQILNGLQKNEEKTKLIETVELKREGGLSLFFDYAKNNLDNNSTQEFQQVESCSKNEIVHKDIHQCLAKHVNAVQSKCHVGRACSGSSLVVVLMLR